MSSSVITPGPSLVAAAGALGDRRRLLGAYPYQWLYPGPNSKHVDAEGSAPVPAIGLTAETVSYRVPEGLRFSLRGIVAQYFGTGWTQGDGSLLWTLRVQSGGSRNVDFYTNIKTARGSSVLPYPILGRLEFQSLDLLTIVFTNVSLVIGDPPAPVNSRLVGHTYPNSEAA